MSTKAASKPKNHLRPFSVSSPYPSTSPTSTSIPASAEQNYLASGVMAHPFGSGNLTGSFLPNHGYPGYPLSGFVSAQNGHHQQTYPSYQPSAHQNGSTGNSDLDTLERLKREILAGQNPHYTAVPQPAYLESLYLGRSIQKQSRVFSEAALPTSSLGIDNSVSQVVKVQQEVQTDVVSVDVHKQVHPVQSASINTELLASACSSAVQQHDKHSTPTPPHAATCQATTPIKDVITETDVEELALSGGECPLAAKTVVQGGVEPAVSGAPTDSLGPRDRRQPTQTDVSPRDLQPSEQHSLGEISINSVANEADQKDKDVKQAEDNSTPTDKQDRQQSSGGSMSNTTPPEQGGDQHGERSPHAKLYSASQHDDYARSLERQLSQAYDDSREVRTFYEGKPDKSIPESSSKVADGVPEPSGTTHYTPTVVDVPASQSETPSAEGNKSPSTDDKQVSQHTPVLPPKEERKLSYRSGHQAWPKPSDSTLRIGQPDKSSDRLFLTADETRALQSKATLQTRQGQAVVSLEERIGTRTSSLEERIGARVQSSPDGSALRTPPISQPAVRTTPLQQRISDPLVSPSTEPSNGLPRDLKPSELLEALRNQKTFTDLFKVVKQEPVDIDMSLSSPTATTGLDAPMGVRRNHTTGRIGVAPIRHEIIDTHDQRASRPVTVSGPRSSYPAPRDPARAVAELVPREGYHDAPATRQPPVSYLVVPDDRRGVTRKTDVSPSGDYLRSPYRPRPPYRERDQAVAEERGRPTHGSREWRERERASYPAPSDVSTARESYPSLDSTSRYGASPANRGYGDRSFRPAPVWDLTSGNSHDPERVGFVERERARGDWHNGSRDYNHRPPPPPSTSPQSPWVKEETIGRPLSSRVPSDSYTAEDRIRREVDREHYPAVAAEFISRESSRARHRTPSPYRRAPPVEDLRPNKRARDETTYYDIPERRGMPPPEFHDRAPSPPPSSASSVYDPRAPLIIPRNDPPTYSDERSRPASATYYDRPPYSVRPSYPPSDGHAERRYSGPPPRTA